MLQQANSKWTKALVSLSIPVFVGIGMLILLLIGATAMMI